MRRDLDRLEHEVFDVLVIGGGITGACVAHDAALRGLSVALIEQQDFGAATSSASSKLLHGGIRYLQQARFDKVRESARERTYFQTLAPHLTRYVPFLIPTYGHGMQGRAALAAGMAAYALLCAGQNRLIADPDKRVPPSTRLSRRELLERVPGAATRAATGAAVLYESHVYSTERMTLAFLKTAVAHGAVVANYVAADAFLRTGTRVEGVTARDTLSGRDLRIRARLVANAAGPWIAGVNARLGGTSLTRRITGFSKGAHIVTRQIIPDVAIALPTARKTQAVVDRGGRHIFVIPWRGHSLIGTTNSPFEGALDEVRPDTADIDELIADVNGALPAAGLGRADVRHAFAGLYPLTEDVLRDDVYQGTGRYQVVDHGTRDGVDGWISVLGAKFTTARRVAERAVDLLISKLGRPPVPCATHHTPLVGGTIARRSAFEAEAEARYPQLGTDVVRHLASSYGTEMHTVLERARREPGGEHRLSPDRESIEAEVAFAVDEEMAMRLDDVVLRRTGLGTLGHPGGNGLARCADIMGARLGWQSAHADEEIRRVERLLAPGPPA